MNILFLTSDYKPSVAKGGVAEYSHKVAKGFAGHGCNVIMLAPDSKGDTETFDRQQPFQTYRLPNVRIKAIRNLLFVFYTGYLFAKHDIDCIYSAMLIPCGIVGILFSALLRVRVVIAVYGHEVTYSQDGMRQKIKSKIKFFQAFLYNRADTVFANSNYTRNNLVSIGVSEKKAYVSSLGIDLEDFESNESAGRIIAGQDMTGKKVILTVSRLVERKGHDKVIEALPKILETVPDAVYIIAGTGEHEPALRQLVKEKDLGNHVLFLGSVKDENLLQVYNACDVFIMPSRIIGANVEGFGIVFLEASACKKPVIGGNSGGIPDAVVNGQTGFLVDPKDADAIGAVLIRILSNDRFAREMGQNGYNRIKRELTWDKVTSNILKILEN